jgi:hypothetical protein
MMKGEGSVQGNHAVTTGKIGLHTIVL